MAVVEKRERVDCSVLASASSSTTYLGSGMSLGALELPDTFTTNTARVKVTFYGGYDGDTSSANPQTVKTPLNASLIDEAMITVTAASNTNRLVGFPQPVEVYMYDTIKLELLQSDESTAVAQGAARTITALVAPVS